MYTPAIYRNGLFDEFFGFPFSKALRDWDKDTSDTSLMKTDIKEHDGSYELIMDLPGIEKENLDASLKDGYLTVTAKTAKSNDEKDNNGKYLRRERYTGTYSRSFYVGELVTEEDIKAKFENGTLNITIPKKDPESVQPQKKFIAIEG